MAKYEIKDGVGIIPEGTDYIVSCAFEDCKELTSVVIPNTVTCISWDAFSGCSGLKSIVIPNSVTEIESEAFRGCSGLTNIVIPESVKKIDLSAFAGCTGITSIVIPKSVREISWHSSFFGCRNLTSIVVEEGNEFYDSRENCNAIIETEKNALIAGCKTSVIPSSVTKIMSKAFSEVGLSSFVVPDNIVSISAEAFSKNDELQTITIGSSIKSFGEDVFKKCDNLKRVILKVTDPSQIQIDRGVELGGYQATLCVPDEKGVLAAYKKKAIWKKFAAIETFVAETGQNEGNDEWASFLELIGMKDSKLKLKPISPEYDIKDMLTVTYHVTEDMLPFTVVLDDAKAVQMYVDDQVAKPFKKKVTFKKAGDHVVRLFALNGYQPKNTMTFKDSELIKIPDNMTEVRPKPYPYDFGTFNGSKKLLLGAGYTSEAFPEKDFEEIAVVPTNTIYESRNGCIILKESQKLLYVSASATTLPDGIKSLKGYWILKRWSQPKLFIPGTIQSIELDLNKVGFAEEIEFGEGVQEVILRKDPPVVNEVVDCKVRKVILPQSVTSFKAPDDLKKLVEKK